MLEQIALPLPGLNPPFEPWCARAARRGLARVGWRDILLAASPAGDKRTAFVESVLVGFGVDGQTPWGHDSAISWFTPDR